MKIKMISTQEGSVDGIRIATYEAGCEYELARPLGALDLAAAFVAAGMAEEVRGDADPSVPITPAAPAPGGDMSKAELQAALDEKGIKYPAAANKAELQALLAAS